VEEEVDLRHTLELLEATGPRAPRPVVPPRPAPPALEAFAQFEKALAERCWVSTRTDTTIEMKGAESEKARCMKQAFVQELDRVLVPLKARDAGRFAALMREQAAWNRLVDVSCPFFDEIQFADLDAGVWGFGTIYGFQERACEQSTAAERAYYAAALRTDQAPLLAAHVRLASDGARVTRAELGTLRRALAKWLAPPGPPPDSGRSVTAEDARRLLDTVTAIEANARDLARVSCANWPALASALGGNHSCAQALESYYLQHR
jgi:lysozyme inhibitor LprI